LSKAHASSGIARVEFKEDFKCSAYCPIAVFSDRSVGTIKMIKRRKVISTQEGVLKAGKTVSFSLHFEKIMRQEKIFYGRGEYKPYPQTLRQNSTSLKCSSQWRHASL
jgi:hypothetical protein